MFICGTLKCLYKSRRVTGHVYMWYMSINFASVSTVFILDFGTVLTIWYFHFVTPRGDLNMGVPNECDCKKALCALYYLRLY